MTQNLFTREEVMAGLPARRASTLLFLIESRTAHMVAQSRQAMERFLTEEAAKERDLAFLEAFALGRDPPLRPRIQHLERHAPQWAPLVPENPRVRAVVAHLLGQKYAFTHQAVPGIQAALGLDEEAVQQAYHRLYSKPLETIYALQVKPVDRLRWAWAALAGWIESLPPFWTAFALILTETVGAGVLALPIALAGIGPLAGVVLLVVMGLVSMVTVASMAEANARSGPVRYGGAFIGRMVNDYLGSAGSLVVSLGIALDCMLALLAYYAGFSTTLADATGVPAEVWAVLLFLVGLYFLRRESLDATIASALAVGAINIALLLIISLLAFTHLQPENLLHVNVPFLGGRPFEPSILQLVFGVIITAYCGYLSMSNCARVVLRRDPSARSLTRGAMAAQAVAIVIYSIWVLAVNGVVAPEVLASETGTALASLAAQIGPGVHVLSSIYVTLAVAMISITLSFGLFNVVRERLPPRHRPIVVLPRQRGRLLFHQRRRPNREPRIGLAYLGLIGKYGRAPQPQFRLDVQLDGNNHCMEMAAKDLQEDTALPDRLPDLRKYGASLALEVLDASQQSVHLRVTSPMTLTYEGEWDATGLQMTDVLTLPDPLRKLITWMTRQGQVSLAEVAAHTGQGEETAGIMLEALIEQGFVQKVEGRGDPARTSKSRYRIRFAPRRERQLPEEIWQALDEGAEDSRAKAEGPDSSNFRPSVLTRLGKRGRFFISASPVIILFLLAEWQLLNGRESFPGPLSLIGVIIFSLLAGVFPVLMLVSSRRKGEFVPGLVLRWLRHPVLIIGIYALYLASPFLHGLVIWQGPIERAGALAVGMLIIGLTIVVARRGAFTPRMVVELRGEGQDEAGLARRGVFAVTSCGKPAIAEVRLGYPEGERRYQAATGEVPAFSSLRYATFQLPAGQAQELKVWAHKTTPEGDSESLPALLEAHCGDESARFDLRLSSGQALLPLTSEKCQLEISLLEESP